MGGRASIAVGLGAGVIAGVLMIALVALLLPPPDAPVPPASGSASPGVPAATQPTASASPVPSASADPDSANFHIGEIAPTLKLPQLGGGEIDLAGLRGTPVWVNFMGTYCPPCRDEFPKMNSFAVRYADTGLVVIAVDVREDVGTVNAFAQEFSVQFPMALDEDGAAQREWGAWALPMHFWIDAEGIVRDGAAGGIGPDLMAAGLEKILPGVDVEP
jgi:thiol-disulfide isomerase/thioredoxin